MLLARYDEEAVLKIFGLLDVNSDGQLSRVELREAFIRYPPLLDAPGMGSQPSSVRNEVRVGCASHSLHCLSPSGAHAPPLNPLAAHALPLWLGVCCAAWLMYIVLSTA